MALDWLRSRDAGLGALRRAGRAAIVMPLMFALGSEVIKNGNVATFAAFGSFSMVLLVDFSGSRVRRVLAQLSLIGAGLVMVTLGTLVSRVDWLATVAMIAVGFAVLFAAVVSSVLASATTALLLGFILPVTIPARPDVLPDRLAGWVLAGAASLVAITLLWPTPTRDPLRRTVAAACSAIAGLLRVEVAAFTGTGELASIEPARAVANEAVTAMRTLFFATPYRPTGLSTSARSLVRLVDEVIWLATILDELAPGTHIRRLDPAVCAVKDAAAAVLIHAAQLLTGASGDLGPFHAEIATLRERLELMETSVTTTLPITRVRESTEELSEFVSSLEPSFRAQEMSFAVSALGTNVETSIAADQRSWWQQVIGSQAAGALASAQQRAGAHFDRHSAALHNSIRGAIGLGVAVLVANVSGVQHSFWIVLGTLSVLRSNALTTGQTAVRGVLGTVAGFAVGGVLVELIGTDRTVLWTLLPLAILFAGMAPAVISFAAGQAGFTVTLLILYNLISPAGWRVGLVRVEDVAIGCVISLGVGILLWPRGAGAALSDALAEAYRDSAQYLRTAVAVAISRCDSSAVAAAVDAQADAAQAAAAARRVDDAFRGFLAERGTKHVPLSGVSALVTGVAGLRLTADAVLSLWDRQGSAAPGDRAAARAELESYGTQVADWYGALARSLTGAGEVPERLHHDRAADNRIIEAVRRDLTDADGVGTPVAVRMIWTAEHVDAARRLQRGLVGPAQLVARERRRSSRLVHRPLSARPEPSMA